MTESTNSPSNRLFTALCLSLVAAIGTTVLYGWVNDILILKTILPGRPDMKANAAICFLLMVLAITVNRWPFAGRISRALGRLFAFTAFAMAVTVLLEYTVGRDLGLDQLFIADPGSPHAHSPPGRFSPVTAMNFILLSVGFLLSSLRRPWHRVSQALCLLSFLISFQSFLGGALGISEVFGMNLFIPMAVPTAFSFSLLSLSILSTAWRKGFLERFTARTSSAAMARSMLAAVILVPPSIRGLASLGAHWELYSEGFAVFLQAMGSAVFMSIIVITTAGFFLRDEREREKLRERELAALKAAEIERDRLYSVFRQAPTHVDIYRGPEHHFVLSHPKTAGLVGRTDLVGERMVDVFPELARNGVLAAADHVYRTGEPYDWTESEIKEAGPGVMYFNLVIQPWRNTAGEVEGIIIFGLNVTEQVLARKAVQEASEAKSQFLANISHEIRTPLGIILGFSDLALESMSRPDEASRYVGAIRRNAEELSKLLGEVLDLSKVEANKLEIEKIEFELAPLLEGVRELLEIKAREKGIRLELETVGPIPQLICSDPTRLRQILVNLIGNAIKFTTHGFVRVTVSAERPQKPDEPTRLRFEVRDTGIGISGEQRERLFKPFSQADGSVTRRFGGTGLGLSISRDLATALGGALDLVESSPGKGSLFSLVIDAGKLSEKAWGPQAANHQPRTKTVDLSGIRLLVVEDSRDNQELITHYLRATGAAITVRENGADAIETMSHQDFDLVLMDIQMPVLDGFRTVKALRERGASLPIIALTAHAMREERQRAHEAGFSDYLTKPISRSSLYAMLEKWAARVAETQA